VVLLLAVARLAAMVLRALMPTKLSATFLDIYLGSLEMLTGVRKATVLHLRGPDRSHRSKLLSIGTAASYSMLLELAVACRFGGCMLIKRLLDAQMARARFWFLGYRL
jgi:hypothetical protein